MAQRGGTVNSDVRFGAKVYSPTIPEGDVDVLLAFEQMEALRYLPSLKPGGIVIVNEQRILPSSVSAGKAKYPENVNEQLNRHAAKVISLDALALAREAGSVRSVNVCLLGALGGFLDIDESVWREVIARKFANKGLDANLCAFDLGRRMVDG